MDKIPPPPQIMPAADALSIVLGLCNERIAALKAAGHGTSERIVGMAAAAAEQSLRYHLQAPPPAPSAPKAAG